MFVTGVSHDNAGSGDYATVAYDSITGEQRWAARYDGPLGGDDNAVALAVSADGAKVFVTGSSQGSTGTYDYATVTYDASTGHTLWVARYEGQREDRAVAIAASPNGSTVFVTGSSEDQFARSQFATFAYRASDGKQLWIAIYAGRSDSSVHAMVLSPDGSRVYVGGNTYRRHQAFTVVSYNTSNGSSVWVMSDGVGRRRNRVTALGISPDGTRLFVTGWLIGHSGNHDYGVVAHRASTGVRLWFSRYDGTGHRIDDALAVAVSPDGSTVFVTGRSKGASSYDIETLAYYARTGHTRWFARYDHGSTDDGYAVAVSPNGSKVFVTGRSRNSVSGFNYVTVAYRATTGKPVWSRSLAGDRSDIGATAMCLSPVGSTVFVTGGSAGSNGYDDFVTVAYPAQ